MSQEKKNNKHQVSIVIPAYNEEQGIGAVLQGLLSIIKSQDMDSEIIVVDDGSNDRTAEIVKQYSGVTLIQHERNKGYGAALKTGINQARYDNIAITDADGSYPISRLPELVSLIDDYDMVVGARVGSYAKVHLIRQPVKWLFNKYANYLVRDKIPDLNSGLRVFKKDVFEKFRSMLPNGFSLTTTITLALLCNDYRVKFIPIDYCKRGGKSKFRPIRDTINFLSLITRTSLYFNPLRVFMPIALLFLGLGTFLLGYEIFILQNITEITIMIFLWGMQFGMMGLLADMISKLRK